MSPRYRTVHLGGQHHKTSPETKIPYLRLTIHALCEKNPGGVVSSIERGFPCLNRQGLM